MIMIMQVDITSFFMFYIDIGKIWWWYKRQFINLGGYGWGHPFCFGARASVQIVSSLGLNGVYLVKTSGD